MWEGTATGRTVPGLRVARVLPALTGRNTQVRAGVSFLLFRKIIWGCDMKRAHLSWLRGEHSFQKDSLGQEHVGRAWDSGEGCALQHLWAERSLGGWVRQGHSMYRGVGRQCPRDPMANEHMTTVAGPRHRPSQADRLRPVPSAAGPGGACSERPGRGRDWQESQPCRALRGQAPHGSYPLGLRPASWGLRSQWPERPQ